MLLLHGALLMLLTLPTLLRSALPQSLRVQLLRPPPPKPLFSSAAQASSRSRLAAIATATMPSAPPAIPVPEAAAAPAAVAASAPPALDLRLPLTGPQQRPPQGLAGLAAQMRSDPRANSPRLSLEERMAVALGTPCFVDELNADGQVQRYPGRWVALPSQSDSIWQGVTGNTGVGGKAPPIAAPTCQRQ